MENLTELQKKFVLNHKSFHEQFKEKSKELKFDLELIPKEMRSWLTTTLVRVPFQNLNMDEETYSELCTLPIEKMEWGVIQKASQIILSTNPEHFKSDDSITAVLNCLHSDKDSLKYCDICEGKGRLKSEGTITDKKEILLLSYNSMVQSLKKLSTSINNSVASMRDEIVNDIWFNQFSDRDRFNFNGEIAKLNGKQKTQILQP